MDESAIWKNTVATGKSHKVKWSAKELLYVQFSPKLYSSMRLLVSYLQRAKGLLVFLKLHFEVCVSIMAQPTTMLT